MYVGGYLGGINDENCLGTETDVENGNDNRASSSD